MSQHAAQPEFTGIQKYPGLIGIVFTIIVASVFIGMLYRGATSAHHEGGDHEGGDHAAEAAH